MSVHEQLIAAFEKDVLAGKKKLTENERLIFKAGIAYTIGWQREETQKGNFVGFIEAQFGLLRENEATAAELIEKLHKFYCDNCSHTNEQVGHA